MDDDTLGKTLNREAEDDRDGIASYLKGTRPWV
jgi:hypothetical protein